MAEFTDPAVGDVEATAYEFLDTLSYVRVTGATTGGRWSVVDMHLREGHAPPMHVHEEADETIHVLDGTISAHTADHPFGDEREFRRVAPGRTAQSGRGRTVGRSRVDGTGLI